MEKLDRQKEIKARIVRDNPNPDSIGNGVHREESKLAEVEAKEEALKRAKTEKENEKKRQ